MSTMNYGASNTQCGILPYNRFGSSLGFHVEGRGLDPGGLLCILLHEDSAQCVGCAPLCLTLIIPAR